MCAWGPTTCLFMCWELVQGLAKEDFKYSSSGSKHLCLQSLDVSKLCTWLGQLQDMPGASVVLYWHCDFDNETFFGNGASRARNVQMSSFCVVDQGLRSHWCHKWLNCGGQFAVNVEFPTMCLHANSHAPEEMPCLIWMCRDSCHAALSYLIRKRPVYIHICMCVILNVCTHICMRGSEHVVSEAYGLSFGFVQLIQ